ncbi:MAG: FHA domain-containing protein [Tannerellaceae bacterium]|jgi:hypothetical protein|nr:FHA domain-containing protein [Tannerellaceae bacterium]
MNPHTTHRNSTTAPQAYIIEHRTESQYHSIGERETIRHEQIEIGRDPQCKIRFDDSLLSVSRRHAAIVREADGWKLVRLSRIKQTLVNGHEVSNQWYLQHGDEIQLSAGGPRLGFIVVQPDEAVVPPLPPVREPHESRTLYIAEHIDRLGRRLATSFRQTAAIIAGSLIVLVAALAIWAIADWNKSERFMDETRSEVAGVRQSIESVSSELSEVRSGLDEVKRRQYELARLINRSDENLAGVLRNNTRDIRLHITESENRLTSDIAAVHRNLQPKQGRPMRTPSLVRNQPPRAATVASHKEQEKTEEQEKPTSVYAPCFPYIYYIRLDKIEMFGPKNEFGIFNTNKTSWAGVGFLLDDGRFVTARSLVERWKFREYKELSALNALTEKGGRVIAYFTATSPSGHSFTFTGNIFVADRSADIVDKSTKQSFAPALPDKDVAYLQLKPNGGLQFSSRSLPGKGIRLDSYGFPSQIGISPTDGLASGEGLTTAGSLVNGLIATEGDGFLQIGAGSPVFAVNNSGKPVVVGLLAVSSADGRRMVVPLPQSK